VTGVHVTASGAAVCACSCDRHANVARIRTPSGSSIAVPALIPVSLERHAGARGFVDSAGEQSNVWGGTREHV